MNTPTTDSRVSDSCSPLPEASALVSGPTGDRAPRETITRWRVNRVFWIKDSLPHATRTLHTRSTDESCETEHLGFRCWSGDVEVDVRSPLTAKAFQALPFAEQVGYLRAWEPKTSDLDGPMREGLAAILHEEVNSQAVPYFERADQFSGLDPLYSTALVRGFSDGLKGKAVSSWESFWRFARWVLAQCDPETEVRDAFSGETQLGRRWQFCRLEIARFLDATLNGKLAPLPRGERAAVWQLIDVLAHDANPAATDESHEDEGIMDPLALSLNTVRGVAVHSMFSYVCWIRSHSSENAPTGQNLDDVREAREVLQACLDLQLESSPEIRSVFCANLARLASLEEEWLRDHVEQIFRPHGQNEQPYSTWEMFIRFCHADSRIFALLRQQYSSAILRMPQNETEGSSQPDSRVSLGKHLVVSYCRGALDFEQPGDLLAAFIRRAPEPVRADVMGFVGRSLAQSNGPLPTKMFARLLKLWNWLVQRETPAGGPGFQDRAA